MSVWERARVVALAPDRASLATAEQLVRGGRWSDTGASDRALWGHCQGSGPQPYQVVVDLGSPPAYACSCPSRKFPCKHALALLLSWSAGGVVRTGAEADFAADWLVGRDDRARPESDDGGTATKPAQPVDPEAAAARAAARTAKVNAGLDELDLWLHDQIRGGMAGLERAGYAHFDRMAARMVDAQAPGVASMLRSVPAELARDGWPERLLERLASLYLLVRAHRGLAELPTELAANVRARVGYPVAKSDVLASPGVRDHWLALASVDTVESQLETRRVWLLGTTTARWAMTLSFAPPGMSLDNSIVPGQLVHADLHYYPGSSLRVVVGLEKIMAQSDDDPGEVETLPAEDFGRVRERFAALLGHDPWASRLPALVAAVPMLPQQPGSPWRLRDRNGDCVDLTGLAGDPWPLVARSCGEEVELVGEWSDQGFRPLSLLPDRYGSAFTTALVA